MKGHGAGWGSGLRDGFSGLVVGGGGSLAQEGMWRDVRRRFGANGLWRVCCWFGALSAPVAGSGPLWAHPCAPVSVRPMWGSVVVSCGRFRVRGMLGA